MVKTYRLTGDSCVKPLSVRLAKPALGQVLVSNQEVNHFIESIFFMDIATSLYP
jgi:hypothetical protein